MIVDSLAGADHLSDGFNETIKSTIYRQRRQRFDCSPAISEDNFNFPGISTRNEA